MAKGDKKDVGSAKAAFAKNKLGTGSVAKAAVGAAKTQILKNKVTKINRLDAQARTIRQPMTMGKPIGKSGVSTPGRALTPSEIKKAKAVDAKEQAKISKLEKSGKVQAVRSAKTGAYVAKKTGAKNKMKAQGAKIGSSPTSGYGRAGKK
jgi:hypothetical protein